MTFAKKELDNPKLTPEMQNIINRSHGDINVGDAYDDIDRYKYNIMKILVNDQDILHTLHNKELEDKYTNSEGIITNGDAYRNVSIFSFLKIPGIQSKVRNYICFEVDDTETVRYNQNLITKNIIFRTISHDEDYITDWGIDRQDLLAAIISSKFDWTNMFGMHLTKIFDKGRVADNGYYYREFIYEATTANNLVNKAKNGGVVYRG